MASAMTITMAMAMAITIATARTLKMCGNEILKLRCWS
jgi:hypothetical protein